MKKTGRKVGHRLTATQLVGLGPGDHTDPSTRGLQLRVREGAKGTSRTWLYRYRWRGEWVRLTIGHYPGTDLADARQIAQDLREKASKGIDPRRALPKRSPKGGALPASAAVADTHTIEFLCSEFTERHLRTTRKRPEYAEKILEREVLAEWKGRDARTIAPREVIDLLDGIVDRGSPVMANRAADLLGQLFKFGIHRRIVDASPVQLLYRPGGREKPRERSLSDDELRAFLVNVDTVCRSARTAAALRILLLTGQRRGELAAARWSNIDLEEKTWTIPDEDAKAGRGHVVPLSDLAVAEFQTLKKLAKKSPFVIARDKDSTHAAAMLITRSVARCRETWKKRGVAPFRAHDLRRSCRTGLSKLDVAPHIAERVLNHAPERIAGTYDVHDYLTEKHEALQKWADHLGGLKAGAKSNGRTA